MKKIITSILMIFFAMYFSLSIVHAIETPDTLVIHYYRYNNDYTGYNFWMWEHEPTSKGGKQFNFDSNNKDDKGVFFEIDLKTEFSTATTVGIIIKQGGWEGYREPGGDRFIKLSDLQLVNGKLHAYFVEGQIQFGKGETDLSNNIPDYRPNILLASFKSSKQIQLNLTHDAVGYKLYENDVLIKSDALTAGKAKVIAVNDISLIKKYDIEIDFGTIVQKRRISIQNLYDTPEFESSFTYEGELGVIYSKSKTTFRLWAPLSESVKLNIYNQGHPNYDRLGKASVEINPVSSHDLVRIEQGAWEVILEGDFASKYYTFSVTNDGVTNEVTDPYSYSTGANGLRSMIVDFESTNPAYWDLTERPETIKSFTDYIIWELHVRDLTTHSSWTGNNKNRGKFTGIAESGTSYTKDGVTVSTGLDHIEELGVNAVHLLPIFDFGYIDEVALFNNPDMKENAFNWGYMPYHFNTLEGSYSTNPFDGSVRVYEFKQAVQALHNKNVRVIMDVVYNHTGESEGSNFHKIVPGYYHRLNENGTFSNGSGTGNETASERAMVRKFMVDSTVFLAKEYKLSGFRFDLMALHDIETMNAIREAMDKIDPTIILYGEPWTGGQPTPLDGSLAAGMTPGNNYDRNQIGKLDSGVAAFNDLLRNALKGSPDGTDGGFLQGNMDQGKWNDLKNGIIGATETLQGVSLQNNSPLQNIVYNEAHDNLTLHDKLRSSGVSVSEVKFAQIQSNAMVLTSMGIPFMHAGTEFLRSKPKTDGSYEHNSYQSPDSVNQLRWDRKVDYNDVFLYHKALIHIRKTYSNLRMDNMTDIKNNFEFISTNQDQSMKSIAYKIKGLNNEPDLLIIHSGKINGTTNITLNDGKTYMQVTNRFGSTGLFNVEKGLGTKKGTFNVHYGTSAIYVEVKSTENASIKNQSITINKGEAFDPLSNVNIPNGSKVTATTVNTSIPGFRVISVLVTDYLGNKSLLHYNLNISQGSFNSILGGL